MTTPPTAAMLPPRRISRSRSSGGRICPSDWETTVPMSFQRGDDHGAGIELNPAAFAGQAPPQPQPSKREQLHLSRLRFGIVWVGVVGVSSLNGLLATTLALLYYAAMHIRNGYMIESVGLLPLRHIPIITAAYAVLAIMFWRISLLAIVASIRSRQLVFHIERVAVPPITTTSAAILTKKVRTRSPFLLRFRYWRRCRRYWRGMFADGGPLAITPETFEFLFLLREITEISTQSYQAYKCSKLIAQPWINHFYVATLSLNCWIAPLIHVRTRHNPALQRFLYLCSDATLDFASTFVIPMCIICSVVVDSFANNTSNTGAYAFDVPMDDVSFLNGVKAVQQVFVVTWLDFFTKMLPFLSMASCLRQIKRHVQPPPVLPRDPQSEASKGRKVLVLTVASAVIHARERLRSSVVLNAGMRSSIALASTRARSRVQWICGLRIVRFLLSVQVVHTLFFLWGVAIAAVHLDANLATRTMASLPDMACKASSRPWLVRKFSCTILEINCHRLGIAGHASEIAAALSHVDALGVSSLILSHCMELQMPRELQSLTNLMGLEITNATIHQWNDDAALTENKLSAMQYLSLVRVNMTALPRGLQSRDFPVRLRDLTIAVSNLTTLPPDLHTKWTRPVNLFIERTQMSELPTTIAHMRPDRLSLFGNQFTTLDASDSHKSTNGAKLHVISVARNPITQWHGSSSSSSIGDVSELYLVLMDYTKMEELPAWLTSEGERRVRTKSAPITVSAGGSPYCRRSLGLEAGGTASSPPRGLVIQCREKCDEELQAYPLSYNLQMRVP